MKFIVKWQWKIINLLKQSSQFFEELTGEKYQFVGVPEDQWLEISEEFLQTQNQTAMENEDNEDPLIAEAMKLVGADLIEIKN